MTDRRRIWLTILGVVCFAAAGVTLVPELAAERFGGSQIGELSSPVDEAAVERVDQRLKMPGVTALAREQLGGAQKAAFAKLVAELEGSALEEARSALSERRYAAAERLVRALIAHRQVQDAEDTTAPQGVAELDKARLLLANLLSQTDRPAEAARVLDAVSDQTPVGDFVHWLRGRALTRAGQHAEAADAYNAAIALDTTLVEPRARVERAHALAEAGRWEEALAPLEAMIDAFPDYPRRHRLLLQHARALEALERPDEAAAAYQRAWFEFPYKEEGKQARKDALRLAEAGHSAPEISRDERFQRYRRMRINKHWPTVKELFVELLDEHATDDGHSKFEHEILMQLALNDYIPQHYEQALAWLLKLQDAYDNGHTAGIDSDLMYRYLSRTYSQLGQLDKALEAIEKMVAKRSRTARASEKAKFFEQHGMYTKARELYDTFYSDYRKRGWHYTWLLYKSGEFQQAYENLSRLAERSRGQRRAKYMYWASRTLERSGKPDEAYELFADVANAYESSYYGIQARSRMLDIEQRRAVDGSLLAQTRDVVDSGDEALLVMDQAGRAMSARARQEQPPYRDPRQVPRTGAAAAAEPPAEADQLSTIRCEAETAEDQKFCQLMAGELPEDSLHVLQMALAPMRPYAGLLSTSLPAEASQAHQASLDDDTDDIIELGDTAGTDAPAPSRDVKLASFKSNVPRASYNTDARIYWEGRKDSPVAFVKAEQGQVIGPLPDKPWAYDDTSYHDGLERAVAEVGELFPQLVRAQWLRQTGHEKYARWTMREAIIEYRALSRRSRPTSSPHDLPDGRYDLLIDNRRRKSGLWGNNSSKKRYPIPSSSAGRRALLERQQKIYDRRSELRSLMLHAMKDVGDYHLVRRHTLGTGPWYRKDPQGPMRHKWMQAYPRAFPKQVLRHSVKHGLNPYVLWALMTVESSYNPDSVSSADAIGLMQVIPRTGYKTAEMLGDEDFGPFDLIDEDVSIEHGAFYFSKLIEKFHGQELLAFAGYNGGPHRVSAWLEMRGEHAPLDEFVEEIPFNQARGYAKKVLRFVALYLRIYEGIDHVYVGQNMRLDYLPDPNF